MNKTIELLAPAGNLNKLHTALHFGADAVYCGAEGFSLRAQAANMTLDQLEIALDRTHRAGKKLYLALNIFADDADFETLPAYVDAVSALGVDALIVSDPGVIELCRTRAPKTELHLSTQANTTNRYSAAFWVKQGVRRIVLARETKLEDIARMRAYLPSDIGIEAFVHGAMCISYSGRCLLSNFLSGRESNRGDCVQACRWEYEIRERNRGGLPLTIGQEARGTYLLNSKDLNMLPYLDRLVEAGADSLKIEGRMKSESYVAGAVHAYRTALDAYLADPKGYRCDPTWLQWTERISHRAYSTGMYFADADNVCADTSKPQCDYTFVAQVIGYDAERGAAIVEQRNRFAVGDELTTLSADPSCDDKILSAKQMFDEQGAAVADAYLVQQILYIPTPYRLGRGDILMKKGTAK